EITSRRNSLKIVTSRTVSDRAARNIIRDVRHMFRLDDDLQSFYEVISAETEFAWIAEQGAGRLLRSPTVYEDLVKMICTTNCSWICGHHRTPFRVRSRARSPFCPSKPTSNSWCRSFSPDLRKPLASAAGGRLPVQRSIRNPCLRKPLHRTTANHHRVETCDARRG